jgi:hypothetical protein
MCAKGGEIFCFWAAKSCYVKRMKTLQRDNGVTAHGASIRTIIYENGTFKQKPQNIYNIAEPISPEA